MIMLPRDPFKPMAERVCRHCGGPVGKEGAIFAIVGADCWSWCSPAHAAACGIWPWTEAALLLAPIPEAV